jgi:hypothetical protein
MARQFREQLEEEAANFDSKMNIDPGIDTSLTPKPAPTSTQVTTATPAAADEEQFYPPDHHMHPSQRAAAQATAESTPGTPASESPAFESPASETPAPEVAAADAARAEGAQAELDLSPPPADAGRDPR